MSYEGKKYDVLDLHRACIYYCVLAMRKRKYQRVNIMQTVLEMQKAFGLYTPEEAEQAYNDWSLLSATKRKPRLKW